VYKDDMK